MSLLKKRLGVFVAASLVFSSAAYAAGIPVIDAANLAQAIQQVASWARQYQQMYQQITELQQSYRNLHGARGMGSLVNNPASRQYLPAEYRTILSQGVGQWQAIYEAAKKFDIHTTTLAPQSDAVQIYEAVAKQAAINRAVAEEGYKTASQRFGDLQVLLEKVNNAPDAKDIADLQARIQIEQAMLQNEANKLQTLAMLASAQRDLEVQQSIEIAMKSWKGGLPPGW